MKFDDKCCRCRLVIKSSVLGVVYGGVICVHHRSCVKCWFSPKYQYGQRKTEPKLYRNIPLVNSPRKYLTKKNGDKATECYGCYYKLPYHTTVRNIIELQNESENEYRQLGYILVE